MSSATGKGARGARRRKGRGSAADSDTARGVASAKRGDLDRGSAASSPGSRRPRAARSASSIARSIALSLYLRRFFSFLVFDVLLALALAGAFAYQCAMQVPEPDRGGIELLPPASGAVRVELAPESAADAEAAGLAGFAERLWNAELVLVSAPAGTEYAFPLSGLLVYAVPVGAVALVAQVASLLSAPSHTRLIRRKLKPLNDLARAAEAIGSAAAAADRPPASVGASAAPGASEADAVARDRAKFESLERAISTATVDAPTVSTGDKDLRSIEVALNSLLRRMQDAKLQQMRFVSDASHELRTPIAVIQGYVNMLDRWGKTDEEVLDESIDALKAEADHMQELVEQLLFLARGDSGRAMLEREEFSLAGLVAEVGGESQMIDDAHGYLVEVPAGVDGADGSEGARWRMVGDRAMVKQSLRVIVQNAARYSPPGTAVRLTALVDPGAAGDAGRVGYAVQDQGIGMSAHDAEHIFERFYRSDAARDKRAGGTGLGLSIAKWIVDAHGGTIEVLSREGVGTRFTVWFPRG